MSLLNEYINRRLGAQDLENELLRLIGEYNKYRGTYLCVYASAIGKPIPAIALEQSDFYFIRDVIGDAKQAKKLDMYLETPGGSGEAAEEIVRYLRKKFDSVSFVISGEAKSAGTIIALSGDEILMTETGSLGPIDAQMKIGRSVVSAHDYMEWVDKTRQEAAQKGSLNPFDATMVAQITPGELGSVFHSLKFAEDLVVEWLTNYKFKNWTVTETRKAPVTDQMRRERAEQIAQNLTNHSRWRTHGRSLKAENLEEIGLTITKVDADPKLKELVYRIQTVCRLLFETTTIFKIFATEGAKIFRQAAPGGGQARQVPQPQQAVDVVEIEHKCPKCGLTQDLYAKLKKDPKIDEELKKKNPKLKPFPSDGKLKCDCGFIVDLSGLRNQIEIQTGRKLVM